MGLFLIIVIGIAGFIVQNRLQSVFNKYSKVLAPNGMTGKEAAEKMLRDYGIRDVSVMCVEGKLTDHYNPSNKTLNLSKGVYYSNSVAALAVAAHECGHAIQHAEGYAALRLRSALVPIVQFSSMWAQICLIVGILLINVVPALFWVGIIMFAMVVLFSVVTLPVEYNASNRALYWLESSNSVNSEQLAQASTTLKWAARTYLVSALSALATLIYYLGFARGND